MIKFLFIIINSLYVLIVNTSTIYNDNNNKILSKDEVLKITNEKYIDYYCISNICSFSSNDSFVEFPDENGNLKEYIHSSCNYQNKSNCNGEKCTKDIQCLSNKCIDNYCRFNEDIPIIHCEEIPSYNFFHNDYYSYIHCGKLFRENCNTNDECSSMLCGKGTCSKMTNKYSDNINSVYSVSIIIIGTFLLLIIACCCSCYKKIKYDMEF